MRKLLVSFALATSLVALSASPVLAQGHHHGGKGHKGAQKAPLYGPNPGAPCPTGATATPQTFGFAVLNTPGDETTVTGEVSLKHAARNTTYEVVNNQDDSGFCAVIGVGNLTTNRKGNGSLHFTTARLPGSTRFWVTLKTAPEELNTPAVELD